MTDISIIIPTFNRKEKLIKAVKALLGQDFSSRQKINFEVLVIDDGSTDNSKKEVRQLIKKNIVSLRYFRQPNKGPAAARNLGIKKARGKIVLFLGDDILASPDLLKKHLLSHQKYSNQNVAVLGLTVWARELKMTPFMRWMEHGGHQFKYDEIENKKWVNYRYFFTSNLSLKRDFLLKNGLFCEEFKTAAYEDLELGYRLEKKGLKVFYNQKAVGYHSHQTNLKEACRRMEVVGKWSRLYQQKVPEAKRLPTHLEQLVLIILGNFLAYSLLRFTALWCEKKVCFSLIFNALLLTHYLKGRKMVRP